MFKERLLLTAKNIIYWGGATLLSFSVFIGLYFLAFNFEKQAEYITIGLIIIVAIFFIYAIVHLFVFFAVKIFKFIDWQFIEPYKNSRNTEK